MTFPAAGPFSAQPGRCFRIVRDPDPRHLRHPVHCPEPVVAGGTFVDGAGRRHQVEACEEHARELVQAC